MTENLLGLWIDAYFCEGTTFDQAVEVVNKYFSFVNVCCSNCYAVDRSFLEAQRGYKIGKKHPTFVKPDGKVMGRILITAMERRMESEGRVDEISFVYSGETVYATVSKSRIHINIARRDELSQELISYVEKLPFIEKVQVHHMKWISEDFCPYYANLARRLEEGDLE